MAFSSSKCGCHSSLTSCAHPGTAPCNSLPISPPAVNTQFPASKNPSLPTSPTPFVALKNGLNIKYTPASLTNGTTLNVPSPTPTWLIPTHP